MSDIDALWEIHTCATQGLFKYPIEFATGGKQTHTYITIGENSHGVESGTYSMEPGGLIRRDYDYWGANNPHSKFNLDQFEQADLCDFIITHKKAKYDWVGDVLVGIDDVTPAFMDPGFHLIEHIEDKISPFWFCSAFADAAFTFVGCTVIRNRPKWAAHGVTPMDLYRDWIDRGWNTDTLHLLKDHKIGR